MNEEKLLARKTGIGGSDIGPILGLSPYKTAYDVFLDKTEGAKQQVSQSMYWGTILEDIVPTEYAKRTGSKVQRVNQLLRHPAHDFAIANIDRAVINPDISGNVRLKNGRLTTDRILECKTANGFAVKDWGEEGTDSIPETYLAQVQWYLGITSCDVADLAVLIGGQNYRIYTIEFDRELFEAMINAAGIFWENCKKGIAPDPVTAAEALAKFPRHMTGKSIEVSSDIREAVLKIRELDVRKKEIEEETDKIKTQIMTAFEDAEQITFEGIRLATWKNQTSNRIDTKKLQAEQPDIAKAYMKQTESRVFRLSK